MFFSCSEWRVPCNPRRRFRRCQENFVLKFARVRMPELQHARRTRSRSSWRPSRHARHGLGNGLRIDETADKGRVVVTDVAHATGATILREEPIPLAMCATIYCFRCCKALVDVDGSGHPTQPIRLKPGMQQCFSCSRAFCSNGCLKSE